MRISSTDAAFSTLANSNKEVSTVPAAVPDSVKAVKLRDIESKSVSQLTEQEKRELPISDKVVIEAIEKANKAISGANRRFEFSIHKKTKQIMVKVINSETNEIVREIPPEKILDMVATMWEMAGIIVDERR